MSRYAETGEVKALFRQLVKKAGGVEACAVELGISFQRVSHLQNIGNDDEPTYRQIRKLECIARVAIVTGAQVQAIEGAADESLRDAMVGAVQAVGAALGVAHAIDSDGHRTEAECRQAQEATQRALAEVQEAAAAAARMTPGPVRVH